eukprot:6192365-Pleurochrysis_carterae.AAC.5
MWESEEVWDLRMGWARTLFGTCMSMHWGSKLGLYLSLTEHLPTRQIRRINQARASFTPPPPPQLSTCEPFCCFLCSHA